MTTEIRVPQLPESVADATLVAWHKQPGDAVSRDENLADLETDKVVLEVPAPLNGVIREIRIQSGATVTTGSYWRSSMKPARVRRSRSRLPPKLRPWQALPRTPIRKAKMRASSVRRSADSSKRTSSIQAPFLLPARRAIDEVGRCGLLG